MDDRGVLKLLAGSAVFIRYGRVEICNDILKATPNNITAWEAMSNVELLSAVKMAAAIVDGSLAVLQANVDALRQRA